MESPEKNTAGFVDLKCFKLNIMPSSPFTFSDILVVFVRLSNKSSELNINIIERRIQIGHSLADLECLSNKFAPWTLIPS